LVRATIHVENRDGLRKGPDRKVAGDDILRVDEVSGRFAVDQSLHRHPGSGLNRLQVQRDVQGVSAFDRVNDVLPGKSPFPLRVMNAPKRACPRSRLRDRGLRHCPRSWLGGNVGFRPQDGRKSLGHSDGDGAGGVPLATTSDSNVLALSEYRRV
jgi:hypothetical protein